MYVKFCEDFDYITEEEKNQLRANPLLLEGSVEYDVWDESFMREVIDEIPITWTCEFQFMTEDFMREMQDKLSWIMVSSCQCFSFKFVKEFKDKFNWGMVEQNPNIDYEERKKIVKFLQNPKNF